MFRNPLCEFYGCGAAKDKDELFDFEVEGQAYTDNDKIFKVMDSKVKVAETFSENALSRVGIPFDGSPPKTI